MRDSSDQLCLSLLSRQTCDPLQRELLLRLEITEHSALILELALELLKLPSLFLQSAYVAVETHLSIRQALFAAFQIST